MKKLPLTIWPLAAGVILFVLFATVAPKDGDLISGAGDMILGQITGIVLAICLVVDIKKFLNRRHQK